MERNKSSGIRVLKKKNRFGAKMGRELQYQPIKFLFFFFFGLTKGRKK